MGSLYYDLVGILRGAGCHVEVPSVCNGWERRARSSGGFSSPPLAVFHHHTASNTSPLNDLSYMINGCPDAPVGNLLIDRDGICYPIAGGASNCAGKGNQMSFSRGVGVANSGNTWGFQIECANDGVGGAWSQAIVDSLLRASNALNAAVGNQPTDITSHALGDGSGYTDRKIDPARSTSVQGPWQPRSTNSSGTWSLPDMRSECARRAGSSPGPGPGPTPPNGDDDVAEKICVRDVEGFPWITDFASYAHPITEDQAGRGRDMRGWSVDPSSTGPWPIDQQDTDLMHRLSGS